MAFHSLRPIGGQLDCGQADAEAPTDLGKSTYILALKSEDLVVFVCPNPLLRFRTSDSVV